MAWRTSTKEKERLYKCHHIHPNCIFFTATMLCGRAAGLVAELRIATTSRHTNYFESPVTAAFPDIVSDNTLCLMINVLLYICTHVGIYVYGLNPY